jgi:membrane-associated protease RseP (regulator of RpoE activity)
MRTYLKTLKKTGGALLPLAGVLATTGLGAADDESQTGHSGSATAMVSTSGGGGSAGAAASGQNEVVISSIEPTTGELQAAPKDRSWLGVSIEEGTEALESQLGLAPGAGLVVTYVTPDSPAAKAGLEKNDVLVELEGQLLVHPAQLRKLIQVRKEGDTIELVFYRAGKKQTASATVVKAPSGVSLLEDGNSWKGDLLPFRNSFRFDGVRDWPKALRDSLGNLKFDQGRVQEQVRRSMEQASKAYQEAMRYSSNAAAAPALKALRELRHSGIDVDNNASVTVRSTGQRVRSIVKADESGTIVVVCNPKPRLTAHDQAGKLLFDGEIDTPEQRAKVAPELWEKVEPLLDKIAPRAEEETEQESAPSKKPSSPDRRSSSPARPRPVPTL